MDRRQRPRPNRRSDSTEFDLEKARHEVFMLGIKGFATKDKNAAKRELAIRLGATPKKARGKNIKQHLEECRKRKLQQQQQEQEPNRSTKKSNAKKKAEKSRKRNLNQVHGMDYQLGRFKNGVQYLSKEDIERLKSTRQDNKRK